MNTKSVRAVSMAIAGLLFMGSYFWFLENSPITRLLRIHTPQQEIIARAENAFKGSPAGAHELRRKISVEVNKDLLELVQRQNLADSLASTLPLASWAVSWQGEVKSGEKEEKVEFRVNYDFGGRLVGMEQKIPPGAHGPSLSEAQAIRFAHVFLDSVQVDTSRIDLTQKQITREDTTAKYSFTFGRKIDGNLKHEFQVEIVGTSLSKYETKVLSESVEAKRSDGEETAAVVAAVLQGVVWLVVIVFVIAIFVKRLRHDELEFKRAVVLGIAIMVLMWVSIAIQTWPDWTGMLVGGGFAGLFTGAALLPLYAVADSLERETSPERLGSIDLLLRGRARVNEMGYAILAGIFISGLTLALAGASIWLGSLADVVRVKLEEDSLWPLLGNLRVVSTFSKNFILATFVSLLLLSFLPAYLRSRTENRRLIGLLTGVVLVLSGAHAALLQPEHVAVALSIPVAIVWACVALRYDWLTIFLAQVIFHHFIDLALLPTLPQGWLSAPAVVTGIALSLLVMAGLFLIASKKSVKDFEHYVPAYVSRIAQRERFLKELEIAHSVQMRFLPQSVPSVPTLDIACICRPAMEVGGDYYDFILSNENRLGVVIGDVSGKGVSAAFYMTMAKGVIKTLSKREVAPRQMLCELNSVFYESTMISPWWSSK